MLGCPLWKQAFEPGIKTSACILGLKVQDAADTSVCVFHVVKHFLLYSGSCLEWRSPADRGNRTTVFIPLVGVGKRGVY